MGEEKDKLFPKILVPVDGSKFSLHAVSLAARMARYHEASLVLLHVLDTIAAERLHRRGVVSYEATLLEMEKSARGFLQSLSLELQTEGLPVELVLVAGIPHEIILREAERSGATLIIMGKLGKHGIGRILLGSVAERVIEFSTLPVMLATT